MTDTRSPHSSPISLTGTLAGHPVSRIGFGAMQLERLETDHEAAVALLRHAASLGVDHIDTAQFYGDGFVNGAIRTAFRASGSPVIVSKVGADPAPGAPIPLRLAQRPEQLRASVDDNLSSLGLDQIPVVNLRRADVGPGLRAEGDQVVDLDDQLAVLISLRDQGKIGAIGLSAVTADTLRRALPADIACVQNSYSLVSRDNEAMVQLCTEQQIAWVPFFPLGGAFAGQPKVTDEPAVHAIAASLGVTAAQVGLAWLLHRAPNVLIIPGTASVEHLEQNLAAGAITLDEDAISTLDAVKPPAIDKTR